MLELHVNLRIEHTDRLASGPYTAQTIHHPRASLFLGRPLEALGVCIGATNEIKQEREIGDATDEKTQQVR